MSAQLIIDSESKNYWHTGAVVDAHGERNIYVVMAADVEAETYAKNVSRATMDELYPRLSEHASLANADSDNLSRTAWWVVNALATSRVPIHFLLIPHTDEVFSSRVFLDRMSAMWERLAVAVGDETLASDIRAASHTVNSALRNTALKERLSHAHMGM